MYTFTNKLGLIVHEMYYPIENAFMDASKVYFVENKHSDRFYKCKRNIGTIEELEFLENGGYHPSLELELITFALPPTPYDQPLFGCMDMTKMDMLIVTPSRVIIYDVLTKYDVDVPSSFFEEYTAKVPCHEFMSSIKEAIILN